MDTRFDTCAECGASAAVAVLKAGAICQNCAERAVILAAKALDPYKAVPAATEREAKAIDVAIERAVDGVIDDIAEDVADNGRNGARSKHHARRLTEDVVKIVRAAR